MGAGPGAGRADQGEGGPSADSEGVPLQKRSHRGLGASPVGEGYRTGVATLAGGGRLRMAAVPAAHEPGRQRRRVPAGFGRVDHADLEPGLCRRGREHRPPGHRTDSDPPTLGERLPARLGPRPPVGRVHSLRGHAPFEESGKRLDRHCQQPACPGRLSLSPFRHLEQRPPGAAGSPENRGQE